MKLVAGREYLVDGERLTFVRAMTFRGTVLRFRYANGQIIDFPPGEIRRVVAA